MNSIPTPAPYLLDADMLGPDSGFTGTCGDLGPLAEIIAALPGAPEVECRQHLRQPGHWAPSDWEWIEAVEQFRIECLELFE